MNEDFLHFVWKYQKFPPDQLITTQGEICTVLNVGQHNLHDGPDFLNTSLRIGHLKWFGPVEIHNKSSDWYRHQHQKDPNYSNIILHVVWEDDIEVCREDGQLLPTLVLSDLVDPRLLQEHHRYFKKKNPFIPCEDHFLEVPSSKRMIWKERLYVSRIEEKSERILQLLQETKNDWEGVLFLLMARNLGLNINGEALFTIAKSVPFKVVRKVHHDVFNLEALLFGQAQLISAEMDEPYGQELWERYCYLKNKFKLPDPPQVRLHFSRLRPMNFPTIRLAQFVNLYAKSINLFSSVFISDRLVTKGLRESGVTPFWETHYTFNKVSRKQKKPLSASLIDLIKINTLIPLYFCFEKAHGRDSSEKIFEWIRQVKPEKNTITKGFSSIGGKCINALDSQAYIQLKNTFCSQKKCLICAVGIHLLNQK